MPLQVLARIKAMADAPINLAAQEVKNLAYRVFGDNLVFTPKNSLGMLAGEPYLYIKVPEEKYNVKLLETFSDALDKSLNKYKVSYVMPDANEGPTTIKVVFFRDFKPTNR